MSSEPVPIWPKEPVLDMADIQGIAVPGFFKPYQMLLGVRYEHDEQSGRRFKKFLRKLAPEIATATATLRDRRGHRSAGSAKKKQAIWPPLVAIGFSYQGLFGLTPGAANLPGVAFKNGLARRSAIQPIPRIPATPRTGKSAGRKKSWMFLSLWAVTIDRASPNERARLRRRSTPSARTSRVKPEPSAMTFQARGAMSILALTTEYHSLVSVVVRPSIRPISSPTVTSPVPNSHRRPCSAIQAKTSSGPESSSSAIRKLVRIPSFPVLFSRPSRGGRATARSSSIGGCVRMLGSSGGQCGAKRSGFRKCPDLPA